MPERAGVALGADGAMDARVGAGLEATDEAGAADEEGGALVGGAAVGADADAHATRKRKDKIIKFFMFAAPSSLLSVERHQIFDLIVQRIADAAYLFYIVDFFERTILTAIIENRLGSDGTNAR